MSIKKILIIVSIFIISFSTFLTAEAYDEKSILTQLNIIPDNVNYSDDGYVTREEFAYGLSHVLSNKDMENCDTKFADVDETNVYSGYISYLAELNIIHGDLDGNFAPENLISMNDAYKLIISAIGYNPVAEKLGGYPEGYVKEANILGLNKSISFNDGYITWDNMIKLMYNAITLKYKDIDYYGTNANDDYKTLLSDRMNIDVYKAFVEYVNVKSNSITVEIENSLYDTNHRDYSKGTVVTFSIDPKIKSIDYENTPVIIYVNDDCVEAMTFQNNVEVRYSSIYSINGDTDKNAKYAPEYISKIVLDDKIKKYSVCDDFSVIYNEKKTEEPVNLIGNFAKIIFYNDKILSVTAWDLEEGGIINKVSSEAIQYTKGSNTKSEIKNLDRYSKKAFYIDGESAGFGQLKENSYFQYFAIEDDTIIIVDSEKIISDTLYGSSNDSVTIGNITYDRVENIYIADEDGVYRKNASMNKLYNKRVDAYFNYAGEVVYIKINLKSYDYSIPNEFIGVLSKYYLMSDFSDEVDVDIYVLEPDVILNKYKITEKTKYDDGINRESFLQTKAANDGTGIYLFNVDNDGKILKISKPLPYQLYKNQTERTVATKASFPNDSNQYVIVNNKTIYFGKENVILLFKKDGDFTAKKVDASLLQYKTVPNNISIEFFGNEDSVDIKLIVAYGDGLDGIYNTPPSFGIVTNKSIIEDEASGEEQYEFKMISNSDKKIVLNKDLGKDIYKKAFVEYHKKMLADNNEIYIDDIVNLSGEFEEWDKSGALKYNIVDKINEKAIRFSDGETYFMNMRCLSIFVYDDDGFRIASSEEISEGDQVYYNLSKVDGIEAINAIIVKK